MPDPKQIIEAKQLAVEGQDGVAFFGALIAHMGLTEIQRQNFGGNDELAEFLKGLRNMPEFTERVVSLGIVRDAETDAVAAFRSACSALTKSGLPIPSAPETPATNNLRVTVLILPDSTRAGMLETLCMESVTSDPVIPCIDVYMRCVRKRFGSSPGNLPKARAQAFLASRPRPGLPLGHAARAGYWRLNSTVFDHVRQFLRSL